VGAALAIGCSHPHATRPAPQSEAWSATVDSVQRLVADSQFIAADSLLVTFANSSQGSAEANEANFWHAVLMLAPENAGGNLHEALQAFDGYLGSGAMTHRTEALVLQRTAHMVDSLTRVRADDSVPALQLVVTDDSTKTSAREQEINKTVKQLQDSLSKTTAELDRIKKRLSGGKP
jgi:hypothetical protein